MEKSTQKFTTIKYLKADSQYTCLSIILLHSVCRTGKNSYPQVLKNVNMLLKK